MQVRGTWARGRPTAWVSYARSSACLVGVVEHVILPLGYLTMTPHREVEGEVPLEEEGAGGEPLEDEVLGESHYRGSRPERSHPHRFRGVVFEALL